MYQRLAHILQMRANHQLVVVAGWSLVPATRIDNGDVTVLLLLQLAIRETEVTQELDPADFEPDEIIRVIDHSHLVGFSVAHAQSDLGNASRFHRSLGFCRHDSHCPLQSGLRFSRNELTPSRKSAVCRMRAFSSIARSV